MNDRCGLRDHAIKRIEEAFRDVLAQQAPSPLTPAEVREVLDELELMDEASFYSVLPQILLDLLRRSSIQWSDVHEILFDLNVEKAYPEGYLSKLERNAQAHGYEDRSRRELQYLRSRREPFYAAFAPDQASAIVAFLDAVREPAAAVETTMNDWVAAKHYWETRQ